MWHLHRRTKKVFGWDSQSKSQDLSQEELEHKIFVGGNT
jgi:hypothetical protein